MRFLIRLFGFVPLRVLHWLGAALGWTAYACDRTYRERLRENLARSGLGDPPGRHRILRSAVAEAGRTIAELPCFWLRPQAAVARWVRVTVGQAHFDAAHARGRGVLILTPHCGAFEIMLQVELVTADLGGVRALLRALRAGRAVGLRPDQAPGAGEGVWAEFFGRPAYTITLAGRLARSTGATVLMAVARRLPHARGYALEFYPLPDPLPEDPVAAARAINAAVEAVVARCPAQYLWSYNRYKRPAGAPPPPPPPGGH